VVEDAPETFAGFGPEDFDAYLPEKWGSNMFTLPRRRVNDKLAVLGERFAAQLEAASLPLQMHLSDDHPSLWNNKKVDTQWVFFSRGEAEREQLSQVIDKERTLAATLADPTPLYRHVFLGIALDQQHLAIGLRLHHDAWVDRRNLAARLESEDGLDRFLELLGALPDHYEVGLVGGELISPSALDRERVGAFAEAFQAERGWLFTGARLPRDQVAVLGAEVVDTAVETLELLIPVYRFVAWSPDNDAVSMDQIVAERQEAIKATQEEYVRERAEREERRRAIEAERRELRAEVEERARHTQRWLERERDARRALARAFAAKEEAAETAATSEQPIQVSAPPEAPAAEPARKPSTRERPRQRRDDRRPPRHGGAGRPAPAPKVSAERMAVLHVGDQVEVLKGFLKGRFGVIQDIEEKGSLKVSFGALSSRLDADDVAGRGPAPPDGPPGGARRRKRK
jgi:hypothetical protein